jgi:hypothetical protein
MDLFDVDGVFQWLLAEFRSCVIRLICLLLNLLIGVLTYII